MSEQSGRPEPADRPASGPPPEAGRPGSGRPQQPDRPQQPGRSRQPRASQPGGDVLSDLQRWLIRAGARNMRSQFEDQVRRTLSGQRPDNGDVWDIATTEIPSDIGEAPECQWCPICRAARRMRDSRPGLAGQLSGAGDAVSAAVQEAARAFDTLLARAAGGTSHGSAPDGGGEERPGPAKKSADHVRTEPEGDLSHPAEPSAAAGAARPDSLAGEHGPVGWKPGDRLATAGAAADPWGTATASDIRDEPSEGAPGGGTSGDSTPGEPDGRGHGSGDRG